jgi:hypothetical protein
MGEPQHLSDLSHGQLSPGRHPILLVVEDWDAAVADPRGCAVADAGYRVAGFISEWWPTSNRNAGRLRVGMGGRLPSESADIIDFTGVLIIWTPLAPADALDIGAAAA